MSALATGTPCYLTALADFPELAGRVVEVVGTAPAPDGKADDLGPWFRIGAAWAEVLFPGREIVAPRRCLRPIIPPAPALATVTKHTTEPAC